jgi:hypothetical protein
MKKGILIALPLLIASLPSWGASYEASYQCKSIAWDGDSVMEFVVDGAGNGTFTNASNGRKDTYTYARSQISKTKLSPSEFEDAFPATRTYVGSVPRFETAVVYSPNELPFQWVDFLNYHGASVYRLAYVQGIAMYCK